MGPAHGPLLTELVELADLVMVEGVEPVDRLGTSAQGGGVALESVEVLLEGCAVGLEGGDGRLGLLDRFSGVGSDSFRVAPTAEPGLSRVVVGAPHRRSQLGLQLTLQVSDGSGVWLPRPSRRVDGGLECLELIVGVGSALPTMVEAIDKRLPPIVDLLSPRLDPVGHDRF
jgi:hypothetical protein